MITLEEYLKDPCGTLSVPYWKWNSMTVPENVKIIHHSNWSDAEGGTDEPYFRLKHDLRRLPRVEADAYEIETVRREDFESICDVINRSYSGSFMTVQRLCQLTRSAAYEPGFWILARHRSGGQIAGCAIGDLDRECREGILEWVQVLPEYRRQGVGTHMVSDLLARMAGAADFATVAGSLNNRTNPEGLYRKCGFTGNDIWHIVR